MGQPLTGLIDLGETAAALPSAWKSEVLAQVGSACVKVLRMDEMPLDEEVHETTEALLVLEGFLDLVVEGKAVPVGPGEVFMVPAGARHAVGTGSRGTLVIVEVAG